MVRCSKKIKTKRRTIAFASNRERRQRRPAIAGLVVGEANESGSCRYQFCKDKSAGINQGHRACLKTTIPSGCHSTT